MFFPIWILIVFQIQQYQCLYFKLGQEPITRERLLAWVTCDWIVEKNNQIILRLCLLESKLLWHYSLGIFHTSGTRRGCAREDDTNPWLDGCQVQSTFPAPMTAQFVFILILKLCWVTNSQLRDSCLSHSWRNCFDSATNGIQKLSEVASGFRNFTLFWEHEARECHTVSVYRRSHDQPVVPTVNEQEILRVIINNAL